MKLPRTHAPALSQLKLHSQVHPITRAAISLWVGVSLATSAGLAVEVPQLDSLKKEYEEREGTNNSFFHRTVDELNGKYVARVKREQETSQKAGKLDDALAFDKEAKLIGGGGEVPAEDEATIPPALKKMRTTYRAELAKLAAQRDKNAKPLRDEFSKKLNDLMVSLTKEGKLEEATAVKSYREGNFSSSTAAGGSATAAPGKKMSINLPKGASMKFVFCPPGEFEMGTPPEEQGRWEKSYRIVDNQVKVKLTRGFWIAETECTQKQWAAIMDSNPSQKQADNLPVEQISWDEANEFIAKLNQGDHLPKGFKAVLPTEAQWEYACRAGTKTPYSCGATLGEQDGNVGNKKGQEVPVASYAPNPWGLYDMHGNVHEYCSDYRMEMLAGGTDPTGGPVGDDIIIRGGSWNNPAGAARSAARARFKSSSKGSNVGFRIVCNIE